MTESKKVECPHCGKKIDIDKILYNQLEEQLQKQYEKKYSDFRNEKKELEKQKSELEETVDRALKEKLTAEKIELERKLRKEISEEKTQEIKSYQEQLHIKVQEAKELNKVKADYIRLQREKDELQEKIQFESEQKLNQRLEEEKKKFKRDFESKSEMKISEKEHIIRQLKVQLQEAQRKAEQGSMQVQGEVQELAIEEFLMTNFTLDVIEEVKKGVRGADCLQTINTRTHQNCGKILYESKRTQQFQNSWIQKFKSDMRAAGATFGVIITDSMPKGMERLGQLEGVWICSYDEFKGLSVVLRQSIILLHDAMTVQENKGGKMEMLYQFLTGSEFRNEIESIVEGFTQMERDLTKEKRAMENIWKQREKQIQKVLVSTTRMYGSVRGIAGNAIKTITALELSISNGDVENNS